MPIVVRCACGVKLKAKDEQAGKTLKCPKCKQSLVIPPLEEDSYALADDGATSPPANRPSPMVARAASSAKKVKKRPPPKDNRTLLIAAIGGGAAALVLVVGLIAMFLFSGGDEVARNTPVDDDRASAPHEQASLTNPADDEMAHVEMPDDEPADDEMAHVEMPHDELADDEMPEDEPAGAATAARPPAKPKAAATPGSTRFKIRDDNALKMKFCRCPPGKFSHGTEGVEAEITHEFWLGQTEVTQAQWKRVMKTTPWTKWKSAVSDDDYPATAVSWHDARAFCERLTQVEREQGRIGDDLEYRLPTEAEWCYASKAPRISKATGKPLKLKEFAWCEYSSGGRLHAVGELPANVWGLHDIAGNLCEWTLDRFANSKQASLPVYGGENPFQWCDLEQGAESVHIIQGHYYSGSFGGRGSCTSSRSSAGNFGFRVALAPPAQPTKDPGPGIWFVLSNYSIRSSQGTHKVKVDWKVVRGRAQPGKKYCVFAHFQSTRPPFVSKVKSVELDLGDQWGTVEMEAEVQDPNGPREVRRVVVGEEKGRGYSRLFSGEVTRHGETSAAEPPTTR